MVLEGFSGKKLRKEEADCTKRQIQEVTGWNDPVKEKTNFVEAACQNYKVLIKAKWVWKAGGAGPSGKYDIRSRPKNGHNGLTDPQEKSKGKLSSF